jgi:hypothetical protein
MSCNNQQSLITIFYSLVDKLMILITQKIGVTHGFDANSVLCPTNAWRKGQYLLQPMFAVSNHHYTTEDILTLAATIAKDRAGNERDVNICKQSGVIKHGLLHHGSLAALDDTWLAWSFQANFMFCHVL